LASSRGQTLPVALICPSADKRAQSQTQAPMSLQLSARRRSSLGHETLARWDDVGSARLGWPASGAVTTAEHCDMPRRWSTAWGEGFGQAAVRKRSTRRCPRTAMLATHGRRRVSVGPCASARACEGISAPDTTPITRAAHGKLSAPVQSRSSPSWSASTGLRTHLTARPAANLFCREHRSVLHGCIASPLAAGPPADDAARWPPNHCVAGAGPVTVAGRRT
jgi:hypothetical protein